VTDKKTPITNPTDEQAYACSVSGQSKECKGAEPVSESRRGFIKKTGSLSALSLLGTASLMTYSDDAEANMSWAEWFQGNYRLMTDEEKAKAVARLEKRYSAEYGKKVGVDSTPAQKGVLFGYALNIQKCIGCRRCVEACVKENNQSPEAMAKTRRPSGSGCSKWRKASSRSTN